MINAIKWFKEKGFTINDKITIQDVIDLQNDAQKDALLRAQGVASDVILAESQKYAQPSQPLPAEMTLSGVAYKVASSITTLADKLDYPPKTPIPKIVCLCGSTRFWKTFQEQSLRLTKEGVIVLSIGCATASDDEHGITPEEKAIFDELHERKIDLCDRVLVLNVNGYIGESTRSEINYAQTKSKPVSYLEPLFEAAISKARGDDVLNVMQKGIA